MKILIFILLLPNLLFAQTGKFKRTKEQAAACRSYSESSEVLKEPIQRQTYKAAFAIASHCKIKFTNEQLQNLVSNAMSGRLYDVKTVAKYTKFACTTDLTTKDIDFLQGLMAEWTKAL
jgi:hypothetical protein